jgi:hypothetical protein
MRRRTVLPPLAFLVLAACGLSQVQRGVESGKADLARRYLGDVSSMVELYHTTHRRLPDSLSDLDVHDPGSGAVLASRVSPDPWGRPYGYERLSPTSYRLYSLGGDGLRGTVDDVIVARGLGKGAGG